MAAGDHPEEVGVTLSGDEPGQRQDQLGRDRRKEALQRDEERHADVSEPVNDVGDPLGHVMFSSANALCPPCTPESAYRVVTGYAGIGELAAGVESSLTSRPPVARFE